MSSTLRQPNLYEQLEALPETVVGEILEGRLYVQPRPAPKHLNAATELTGILRPNFGSRGSHPGGWQILAEPEIHFLRKVEVDVPDLAGWRRERLPMLPETAFFEVRPDWVCEVLSPRTRRIDREIKMPVYARYGVPYAWLVDPDARTLEAYELDGGCWGLNGRFADDQTVTAAPFETLSFKLDRLWA